MAIKDVLVYADAKSSTATRLDSVIRLAQAHNAHLTALHARARPYVPVDVLGTGVGIEVERWQRTQRDAEEAETRALIAAAQQNHDFPIETRVVEGDIDITLLDHGRYSDLIVVSKFTGEFDLSQPLAPSPGNLVVAAGRPVLVLPASGSDRAIGKHILIAWKASAQATRAVHDALPLLQHAEDVTILSVNTGEADKSHIAGADIATHLSRHGVKVTVMTLNAPDADAGNVILEQAASLGADLIVMGAYGHSRLREMALGGVTRHVLKNQHIPVFLAS